MSRTAESVVFTRCPPGPGRAKHLHVALGEQRFVGLGNAVVGRELRSFVDRDRVGRASVVGSRTQPYMSSGRARA